MEYYNSACPHTALHEILQSRGLADLPENMLLWKLKLSEAEYDALKKCLIDYKYALSLYGVEAALCYAEWWRRDYQGSIPSKEDVAIGLGLPVKYSTDLFNAARSALKKYKYTFIHSQKGIEYFRTLLNQGGLPVKYIKHSDNEFGSFKRFLSGLVKELSSINIDWNNYDTSIIQQFNCISYLSKAYKNDNIYDVAFQIAHAIILEDNNLLPYDDSNSSSLASLTDSLKREYKRSKQERRTRPLSIHWKLQLTQDKIGSLLFNMDAIKDLNSNSIPGLDYSSCYSFDVFVAGVLVAKYVRKSIDKDDFGEITGVTYTRISVGLAKDIVWKGEPVIEVKVRCDNDDRIFLTVAGCYPPNFSSPQLFQKQNGDIYAKSQTANSEENVVIFSSDWTTGVFEDIEISGQHFRISRFTDSIHLSNNDTGEEVDIENKFTPYIAEFSGNYISWVESSNYKLMTYTPTIYVYNEEREKIANFKTYYRVRAHKEEGWKKLGKWSEFAPGLIDIKVIFPDGNFEIETFYYIGKLEFKSQNESVFSTEIYCTDSKGMRVEIENNPNLEIETLDSAKWKISRREGEKKHPTTCAFRIYSEGNPILWVELAIPFDGIVITDVNGKELRNGHIVSLSNLSNYYVLSHGNRSRVIDVSYKSDKIDDTDKVKHLQSKVIKGMVTLSDYHDLILRTFNLYGVNSFDRSSAVTLKTSGKEILIRRYVLESSITDGEIIVYRPFGKHPEEFVYEGSIYALPLDENTSIENFHPIELEQSDENPNCFHFPIGYDHKEVIIFSGAEAKYRIVPKYFNVEAIDYNKYQRNAIAFHAMQNWTNALNDEDILGNHWKMLCRMFEICSQYDIPFSTHSGFKIIRNEPKLLVKFVLAMWMNNCSEILKQDIESFEQEIVTAFHWIPASVWSECIFEMMAQLPSILQNIIQQRFSELHSLLIDLFDISFSPDISAEFARYITQNMIGEGATFHNSEINEYKAKIHGISDNNFDLPIIRHNLQGIYYAKQQMLVSYRVMLESAMCAAENTAKVENATDLFSQDGKENARVINFYRRYFKEVYSTVFIKTLRLIVNPKKK